MKSTKLPHFPSALPDSTEVRDFDLGGGKFARVIMELARENHNGAEHFVLYAQAYEMDKSGHFKTAPLGYPSRTAQTGHSVNASAIGQTIDLDDAWVEYPMDYTPGDIVDPPVVEIATGKPDTPGTQYGETVWSKKDQKLYRWAEGFANVIARTKVEDLQNILKTSALRSGLAFRNR
jgi:hypothetical protein